MENWKPVKDFEDLFEVSDLGNFRRKDKETNLVQHKTAKGYLTVATAPHGKNKGWKTFRVHREVAKAFIENPENKPQVNHKDGMKDNNVVSNLEWCTAKENTQHAWKTGLTKPLTSEQVKNTKLSDSEVKSIYEKYQKGLDTLRNLCNEAGIGHATVIRRHKKFNTKNFNTKVFY
jgi:hypothetical protein